MKAILAQLISDFHERKLPELTTRRTMLPQLPGKATTFFSAIRFSTTFRLHSAVGRVHYCARPSARQRQVVPPKFYAIDTGLLQAMTFRHSPNSGPLLETLVYLHLRRGGYELEFVRTADGYEVDFLARHPISGEVKLLQVCYDLDQEMAWEGELRALNAAKRELRMKNASMVTWDACLTVWK